MTRFLFEYQNCVAQYVIFRSPQFICSSYSIRHYCCSQNDFNRCLNKWLTLINDNSKNNDWIDGNDKINNKCGDVTCSCHTMIENIDYKASKLQLIPSYNISSDIFHSFDTTEFKNFIGNSSVDTLYQSSSIIIKIASKLYATS